MVPTTASALDEKGYWAFADRMQTRIDRYWDDSEGLYSGMSSGAHADVLLTLAVAAKRDHQGPARNDRRATTFQSMSVARNAKGRTSDNLGTDYPHISEALWTAVQNALSGSSSAKDALSKAQTDAQKATN